ncbi:MAG: Laminin sub domain 2 [Labilithrix sp.]|nr:Laminin sub domain 2 [Labilithrix sp.]
MCSDATLAFDGTDDAATVPDDDALDLGGDFTVEAWIKPGAKVSSGTEMDIVSHHDAAASRGWVLRLKDGRAEVVVYGNETFSPTAYNAGNAGPAYVAPGKWAHVAATREGDMLRIYYDGVLRDTQQIGFLFGRDDYNGALRIGRAAYVEDFRFQGEIDDVRLSKRARYTGATAPRPTAVLSLDDDVVASWRFDEISGAKLVDASGRGHDGSLAPDATAPARVASTCIAER